MSANKWLILKRTVPVGIFGTIGAQTRVILMCEQITYKLTNNMYDHLTICKQICSGSFKNVNDKLCVYKSYLLKRFGIK